MSRREKNNAGLIEVRSLDQIPDFANEDDEAQFWGTHELSDELLAALPPTSNADLPPARQETAAERRWIASARRHAQQRHASAQ